MDCTPQRCTTAFFVLMCEYWSVGVLLPTLPRRLFAHKLCWRWMAICLSFNKVRQGIKRGQGVDTPTGSPFPFVLKGWEEP